MTFQHWSDWVDTKRYLAQQEATTPMGKNLRKCKAVKDEGG